MDSKTLKAKLVQSKKLTTSIVPLVSYILNPVQKNYFIFAGREYIFS